MLAVVLALVVLLPTVVAVVLYRRALRRAAAEPGVPVAPAAATGPSPWGPLEVAGVLVLGLGSLLFPVAPVLVGYVLVCCSPRWSVQEKTVAGVLALLPALAYGLSLVVDGPWPFMVVGQLGVFSLVLLAFTGPALAAVYLAVTLSRRR